jgi:hypothetical protein
MTLTLLLVPTVIPAQEMMTIRAVWSETPAAAAEFLEATEGPRMAAASSLVLLWVAATVASASVRPATRVLHESRLG